MPQRVASATRPNASYRQSCGLRNIVPVEGNKTSLVIIDNQTSVSSPIDQLLKCTVNIRGRAVVTQLCCYLSQVDREFGVRSDLALNSFHQWNIEF